MSKRQRAKGFSLAEMMVVLAIMGILASIVGMAVVKKIDIAREQSTRAQIDVLKSAINDYKISTSVFPEYLDDLVKQPSGLQGWSGPYLDPPKVPLDGWKHEFVYFPPDPGSMEFTIMSYGADGEEGGEGLNSDISNLTIADGAGATEGQP